MKRRTTAISGPSIYFCRIHGLIADFRPLLSLLFLTASSLFCGDSHAAQPPPTEAEPASRVAVPTPGQDEGTLKQFVRDYWQRRFALHAERVNWRDYQWQIEVSIPEAVSKLPPCRQTLQAETGLVNLPVGRQRLRLRCPDTPGWLITSRSEISVLMPVVVTRTALAPEHVLQVSDLAVTQLLLSAQQADVLTDPAQAIGRRPLRALRAGQPVRNRALEAAMLVRKGDKVRLTLSEGGMAIAMEGIALQDGQKGEIISIRNERGGKVISATVSGPGQLQAFGPTPEMAQLD